MNKRNKTTNKNKQKRGRGHDLHLL